jgi:hypothetical protein
MNKYSDEITKWSYLILLLYAIFSLLMVAGLEYLVRLGIEKLIYLIILL